MTKVGERLLKAVHEAAAIARGDMKPARAHVPADIDVKAIRNALKLSQEAFAGEFGFSVNQIRDWEQGRTRPIGAIRAYLIVINYDPVAVRGLLLQAAKPKKRSKVAA